MQRGKDSGLQVVSLLPQGFVYREMKLCAWVAALRRIAKSAAPRPEHDCVPRMLAQRAALAAWCAADPGP